MTAAQIFGHEPCLKQESCCSFYPEYCLGVTLALCHGREQEDVTYFSPVLARICCAKLFKRMFAHREFHHLIKFMNFDINIGYEFHHCSVLPTAHSSFKSPPILFSTLPMPMGITLLPKIQRGFFSKKQGDGHSFASPQILWLPCLPVSQCLLCLPCLPPRLCCCLAPPCPPNCSLVCYGVWCAIACLLVLLSFGLPCLTPVPGLA